MDASDYLVWRKSLGQSGATLAADGNGNYLVDSGDLNTWRAHFGQTVSAVGAGSGIGATNSVPEPPSWLMCVVIMVVLRLPRPRRFIGTNIGELRNDNEPTSFD